MSEEKKPVGRPSNYRKEFCDISEYLAECEANKLPPLICGLAVRLETTEKVIHDWGSKFPEFRKSLDKIKAIQKAGLIGKGLNGDYNSTITKLMLSSNHGMHEKQQTEHSGQVALQPPIVE